MLQKVPRGIGKTEFYERGVTRVVDEDLPLLPAGLPTRPHTPSLSR